MLERIAAMWSGLSRWGKVGVVVLGLVILGTVARSPARRDHENSYAGWSACQRAVKDRLKAPSTAKFTDPTIAKDRERGVGVITAAVDSQNSFGAMLRTSFTCTVNKSTDTWVVADVRFGP